MLVGLDGVHIGEFKVAGEVLPKVLVLNGFNGRERHFALRTGNYYDEVVVVPVIVPKPPKV